MAFDLVVRGGTLVTPEAVEMADIGITDGQILEIGDLGAALAAETLNARGLHIFAGAIDSQVHFREPGMTHKEDLESGTRAAIAGGVTTIFEMPNTSPTTTTAEALEDKLERARGRAWCDHAFFVGASAENAGQLDELELLPGTPGIKIFMGSSTGTLLVPDDETLLKVLRHGRTRCPVHSEDHERLEGRRALRQGSPSGHVHPVWRDEEVATLSTKRLFAAAEQTGRPVHLLHVSTVDEVPLITGAKRRSLDVSAEVTPQHLWFAAPDAYDRLGSLAVMNPPIRDLHHREGLRKALLDGVFDVFGSDHAPHTLAEKAAPYPGCPSGMPGVQTLLPAILTLAAQIGLDLRTVAKMTSARPAELYRMVGKGRLASGHDADLAIVDLRSVFEPTTEPGQISTIQSRCGWSPFIGERLRGWPRFTVLRGQIVWREGLLIGPPNGVPAKFNKIPLT